MNAPADPPDSLPGAGEAKHDPGPRPEAAPAVAGGDRDTATTDREDAVANATPAEGAGTATSGHIERAPEAGADTAAEPPDPALLAEAARITEALIFASDRPVTPAMLAAVLPEAVPPALAVATLADACEGRGVVLAEVAGGWAFRTAPDLAQRLTKVVQAPRRLPRAAMEALSVIAYHQPCTRGEVEEIRGATLSQTTLEALLELGLIAPRGRREVPGRPTLWGTTPRFLEQFGLKALGDLPRKEELVSAETAPALPFGPTGVTEEAPAEATAGEDAPEPGGDRP
ncbi:SMC-Scp complex subunit ScpB [Roseomonas sp. HF4]|uniref:SMC-Scp complex subunit ScpB n=1 Tax=Roseomonas sp. HF4 TaxID=2562313 RepID=UPI0010C055DF|nr:SMC-Scp complex subunit ScpB [Roseomonas sp. HF4]